MRPADKERIQIDVVERILAQYLANSESQPAGFLVTAINETIYHELRRLEQANPAKQQTKRQISYYQKIRRRLRHASSKELPAILQQLAGRFAAEIVGNFNERVYQLSTEIIPRGLNVLLGASSPARLLTFRGLGRSVTEHVAIEGEVDHVASLFDKGTVMVVPTHASHLDSVIMGWTIYAMGLPPLLYGAGLNLFKNPILSFFMRNLGAYRVDRKKNARLYKDVLKMYAVCACEYGYHQLFFPGGTRARSGAIEQHLKKGLLGTGVQSYVNNLCAKKTNPNIYVVPCTISYNLVLEAETLIEDHLKHVGSTRYIIEDDEFSRPRRIINFMNDVLTLDDNIIVTFGRPMDVFGNQVDASGKSIDPRGRIIETSTYVSRNGQPIMDEQRDREYTEELASEIAESYLNNNVVRSTHVTARALFRLLRDANQKLDLYRLLHTGGRHSSFLMTDLYAEIERLLREIETLEQSPKLDRLLAGKDAAAIVDEALKRFAIYHTRPAAVRRGDRIYHEDRKLLLYYGNRLEGYGLA